MSIISYPYSGDTYLFLSTSSLFAPELFCGEVFEAVVILSLVLFPINLAVASAFFNCYFGVVSSASVEDCLAWSNRLYLLLNTNKAVRFESSFFWGCQFDTPFIFQEELIQYQYKFMQLLKIYFD